MSKMDFIKRLTLAAWIGIFLPYSINAEVVKVESFKSHLRFNIFASQDQIQITKKGKILEVQTLNKELFQKISNDIRNFSPSKTYIKNIKYKNNTVGTVSFTLANKDVDVFNFYRSKDGKHIIDFWIDEQGVATIKNIEKKVLAKAKKTANKKKYKVNLKDKKISSIEGKAPAIKKNAPVKLSFVDHRKKNKKVKVEDKPFSVQALLTPKLNESDVVKTFSNFRDFRYGASFIWDHNAVAPKIKRIINLQRKTPEFFYKVKDQDYAKGEKESHLQLIVNLYRKKSWGLMYKAMKLFSDKYGEDSNVDLIEYMKANAIYRKYISETKMIPPKKMAIHMYQNIAEQTGNYELRKAIYKFLIQFSFDKKNLVDALHFSKKLFVSSRENFDYEEARESLSFMMYCLGSLHQLNKINKLLKDKTVQKLMPAQISFAYKFFTLLNQNKESEIIRIFEENEKTFAQPILGSILYNTAEAYFRMSQFDKAIKLFDHYLENYSYESASSYARIRIALSYELTDKDILQTINLYKNAINKATLIDARYEAQIRFVALTNIRKKKISKDDRDNRVFLNIINDKKKIGKNLETLLWLVRLRIFIVDGEYNKALSYLAAIPLTSILMSEKRVFEGDGAEVVYGLILSYFKESEYSKIIKVWDIYKNKYISKVAMDPILNFIICQAYNKLGLYDAFDQVYTQFSKIKNYPIKTFPNWTTRNMIPNIDIILGELKIIKNIHLENWGIASSEIIRLKELSPKFSKINYYKGIIDYKLKDYKNSVLNFEKYLSANKISRIYDMSEIADFINAYTDSVYQLGDIEKYENVSSAILHDVGGIAHGHEYLTKILERVFYLKLELLNSSDSSESYLNLEVACDQFEKEYNKSVYSLRVHYLKGIAMIKNKNVEQGEKTLLDIVNNKDAPNTIKDLARSELAMIRIRLKTL